MKKSTRKSSGGGYTWMDTYGDLVTLLLTFFVLLFSFSSVDEQKWTTLINALTGAPPAAVIAPINLDATVAGLVGGQIVMPIYNQKSETKHESDKKLDPSAGGGTQEGLDYEEKQILEEFQGLFKDLQLYIDINDLGDSFKITGNDGKIYLSVFDGILFDSGDASIRPLAQREYLDKLAQLFKISIGSIRCINVEGHTDNVPIRNSKYADNLDLSSMRANNTARYMAQSSGIDVSIFRPIGRSEWEPIAENTTEEGKRKNRRINFVIESKLADTLKGNAGFEGLLGGSTDIVNINEGDDLNA